MQCRHNSAKNGAAQIHAHLTIATAAAEDMPGLPSAACASVQTETPWSSEPHRSQKLRLQGDEYGQHANLMIMLHNGIYHICISPATELRHMRPVAHALIYMSHLDMSLLRIAASAAALGRYCILPDLQPTFAILPCMKADNAEHATSNVTIMTAWTLHPSPAACCLHSAVLSLHTLALQVSRGSASCYMAL